jgi:hypothetical protein
MKFLEIKNCDECPCFSESFDNSYERIDQSCGLNQDINYEGFKETYEKCHPNCPLREGTVCFRFYMFDELNI